MRILFLYTLKYKIFLNIVLQGFAIKLELSVDLLHVCIAVCAKTVIKIINN